MRGLHSFHRHGLSGSRQSELITVTEFTVIPKRPMISERHVLFVISELQTAREDGPGRMRFNNRHHPRSPGHGLSRIGETGKRI